VSVQRIAVIYVTELPRHTVMRLFNLYINSITSLKIYRLWSLAQCPRSERGFKRCCGPYVRPSVSQSVASHQHWTGDA